MNNNIFTNNSYSRMSLLVVSMLATFCLTSKKEIKISINGVVRINPCSNDFLGSFVPKSSLKLQGTESDSLTHKICSNLNYSCCDSGMITSMVDNLKLAIRYLRDRNQQITKLLGNLTDISPETYSIFLDSLTEKDTACFDDIQKKTIEDVRIYYGFDHETINKIKSTRKVIYFDKTAFLSNFIKLRDIIYEYLTTLDEREKRRARHYASFICKMCSPVFSKIFSDDRNPPILRTNVNYCVGLMKESTQNLYWKGVYLWTQQLVDLSYCARTNSKPEKNFDGPEWRGNMIMLDDADVLYTKTEKLNECITSPKKFYEQPDDKDSCLHLCKEEIQFPSMKLISMDRLMNAENEFYNMFLSTIESTKPALRIKQRLAKFNNSQAELVHKGILTFPSKDFIQINMINLVENPPVDFSKVQLQMTRLNGLSRRATDMTIKYYNGSNLVHLFTLCILTALFNSI